MGWETLAFVALRHCVLRLGVEDVITLVAEPGDDDLVYLPVGDPATR